MSPARRFGGLLGPPAGYALGFPPTLAVASRYEVVPGDLRVPGVVAARSLRCVVAHMFSDARYQAERRYFEQVTAVTPCNQPFG